LNQGFAWSIKSPDGRQKLFQKPIDNTRNERIMRTFNRVLAPHLGTQGLEQKMGAYFTQGKTGELGKFGDYLNDDELSTFLAECEEGGATMERGTHAGHQTVKASFGEMVAFFVVCSKSNGDFYRAGKAAGVF
jgi:hypothetical protein